jgi:hypothetical protein
VKYFHGANLEVFFVFGMQEKALIKLKKQKTKYAFIDIGKNLRSRAVNLTLAWDVMPRVGKNSYRVINEEICSHSGLAH